ncbi:LysM peptidoglycan-binding domain-containing protein [Pseudaminobacter sp. NGMCC 1.201702]|uniref:LysM peptidoglycan-binding domain-containing protein n=1 Tax=Pseudaminobacter sp. NGMCC 1.201702 TaxID=3391825 RepID=UPI0039F04FB5
MAGIAAKSLLFLAGGVTAAAATAYGFGVFDPYLSQSPVTATSLSQPAEPQASPSAGQLPDQQSAAVPGPEQAATPQPSEMAAATPDITKPSATSEAKTPAAAPKVLAPSFDVVRAESDGSIVIAGRAAPNAKVEIVIGAKVIGNAVAGPEGDFAVALDTPLEPGGHQIVIRSTTPDNVVATSPETAIVSIPETKDGQVLALVEKPGAPSKLISVPEPTPPSEVVSESQGTKPAEPATAGSDNQPADQQTAAAAQAPETESAPAAIAGEPAVRVEAVEIDGRKIFVAGIAEPGRKVRAYANEILLGEAVTSPGGRFLIEAERDLPVGDYIVRVDALEPDGVKVVARAAVPFEREPGEAISAVAPPASAAQAPGDKAQASPSTDAPGAEIGAKAPLPAGSGDIAAAAPEALAPKLENVDGAVIIRRGDSLWRISRRVYGLGVRYSTIYLANQQQIRDPDLIWPGQVFKVPEKTSEGETANMKAIEGQATTAR